MASNKVLLVPLIIGVIILVLGCILGFVVFPTVLEDEVHSNVVLEEDTLQWYRFREIPFPIKFSVRFFDIKNPNEVLNGSKPILKERGPYVYKEKRVKNILAIQKDTVKYNEVWSFEYDQESSGKNKETDEVFIMNVPALVIFQSLEDLPITLPHSIDAILTDIVEDPEIFVKVMVKDFTFEGIKMCDPKRASTGWSKAICLVVMLMRQKFIEVHDDRSMLFSLFKYKTNPDGPFTLKRGIDDTDQLGLITEYQNAKYTKVWKGKNSECDKVDGHYTTFPPFMEKDTSWKVYSSDICKSAVAHYTGDITFKDVKGYRFATNEQSFASPEQECVCIEGTKGLDGDNHCFAKGVLDMNSCFRGIPVVLSFPHLMWADDEYQSSVIGLNSQYRDDHNTMIDFEPTIGFPLRGALRIQFNLVTRPIKYGKSGFFSPTHKMARALLPIIWVEDSFELTDKLIDELDSKLLSNLVLMEGVKWGFIAAGIFLVILSIGFCIFYKFRRTS